MTLEALTDALTAQPLLPVLRVASAAQAREVAARMARAGLHAVEFTATTDGWPDALAAARRRHPDVLFGLGTVTSGALAERAVEAGAAFLVSPYPVPGVRGVANAAGVPFVEGGLTPGEVAAAAGRGLAKLFPAHVGGPAYLRSLLAVLPGARVVPTGGVRLEDVPAWLDAGAFAVGVGSDLSTPGDVGQRVRAALRTLEGR